MPLTKINIKFYTAALQRRNLNCDLGNHKLYNVERTLSITEDPAQIKMLLKNNFLLLCLKNLNFWIGKEILFP